MATAPRQRRVTSADVAREAGLSRATVSYVLNDAPHQSIPEATRQRVLDAAARLGYAPSAAARALRTGRSDVVLLLLPNWPIGPAVGELLEHLSAALARGGLTLVAHPRGGAQPRPVADIWKAIGPAAVITMEEVAADDEAAMRAAGIEVALALVDRSSSGSGNLLIPQERTGRLQAEHLAAAGHRRLGYALTDDPRLRAFSDHRLDGVRQACADLGLDEPVILTVPLDAVAAAGAVRAWRTADPPVTGICAYNDDVALAVLAGMRECGLTAPDDLAVVGVDDIPAAATAAPPLTTVTTDLRALAEHVAGVVVARLAGTAAPTRPGSDTVHVIRRRSA